LIFLKLHNFKFSSSKTQSVVVLKYYLEGNYSFSLKKISLNINNKCVSKLKKNLMKPNDIISFGKFKGTKISELDLDYVRWIQSNTDIFIHPDLFIDS